MGEDVRIIKLRRESISDVEEELIGNKVKGEEKYFSLDYFDILCVEKKELKDMFATIMNLKDADLTDGRRIAVQSYSLYYSQEMWETYEENCTRMHGNPFEQAGGLGYLSIILVHITPEVLRRMQYEEQDLWKENIILKPFIDDLYDIVDDYAQRIGDEQLVYRVYHVLSTGDLAVAIKSKRSETSFKISSQIRKRVAGLKGEDQDKGQKWTLYKTYTLLAIDHEIEAEQIDESGGQGQVVIRGAYSCKYWAKCKTMNTPRPEGILGLTGRYDFSLEISETEFLCYIYPCIWQIKSREKNAWGDNKDLADSMSEKVKYLIELLENGYLSYVNERYLLASESAQKQDAESVVSKYVLLKESEHNTETLRKSNSRFVDELWKRYNQIEEKLVKMQDMHKNLEQYLLLLKKLIISCHMINELSDTRVYVYEIGKQIETVMNSLEIYSGLYEQTGESVNSVGQKEKDEIAELMVDYLREAVYAMDSYAQYVRNNNLQSLQTPNYNIESNMGMEKLLIGYSEYLRGFIQYYERFYMEGRLGESTKEIVPVVTPDLHSTDMHVEVLFPEGNGSNWSKEKALRERLSKRDKYLLVIDSPTLAELGDMPIFMAMLFHELAHQFRYEKREDRNRNLLQAVTYEVACTLAQRIVSKLEAQMKLSDLSINLKDALSDALMEPLEKQICAMYSGGEGDGKTALDVPLNYFERDMVNKFISIGDTWINCEKLDQKFKQYIGELQSYCNWCSQESVWYIELVCDILSSNHDGQHEMEESLYRTRVEKAAFILAWRAAYEKVDRKKKVCLSQGRFILQKSLATEWCWNAEPVCVDNIWDEFKKINDGSENESDREHIFNLFKKFYLTLEPKYWEKYEQSARVNVFFREVYHNLCKKWEEQYPKLQMQKAEALETSARSWMLLGRQWGIDHDMEVNQDKFCKKIVEEYIEEFDFGQTDNLIGIYRETTSDIFMGKMMKLSPFGYLNLVTLSISEAILEPGPNLQRISYVIYILAEQKCEDIDVLDEYHRHIYSELLRAFKEYKKSLKVDKSSNDFNEQEISIHIDKLEKMLQRFEEMGLYYMKKILQENHALWDDLWNGGEKLADVRRNMEQCDKGLIRSLVDICDCNAVYLEKRHYKTGVVEDETLNKMGIEFMLRLYYRRKFKSARIENKGDD